MRAPRRRRSRTRKIDNTPRLNLEEVAQQVSYIGSREHKDIPSFAGQPKLRADASICPRSIGDKNLVTDWLRIAIRRGAIDGCWRGGFPRYVWYKDGETVYEAMLTNQGLGEYKGYPLGPEEWPIGIEEKYE